MNKDKTTILLGPPGTGKTHTLLDIVERELQDYDPCSIAFLAFTRKAANEAIDRAIVKFGISPQDLPLFRTIHSLAFHSLNIEHRELMDMKDYCDIAKELGLFIKNTAWRNQLDFQGVTKGDKIVFLEAQARSRMESLETVWKEYADREVFLPELQQYARTLKAYKEQRLKLDFTDLLSQFLEYKPNVGAEVVIVDEAQDLSRMQWQIIEHVAKDADKVYIAGDDDQAIFRWAGADVKSFIELDGKVQVLSKSHRVPRAVARIAQKPLNTIQHRREKPWEARDYEGSVNFVSSVDDIDMSHGTWLALARNSCFLDNYIEHCIRNSWLFTSSRPSPIRDEAIQAVGSWERLRAGKRVATSDILNIYSMISTGHGIKFGCKAKLEKDAENKASLTLVDLYHDYGLLRRDEWYKALDRLSYDEKTYIARCLKRGEKASARIHIDTIHGVKGGEAENVVLITDVTKRTFESMQQNPEDEARVWYVGATRASENLWIVVPQTQMYYGEMTK